MTDPISESLNRDFPDVREALARTCIETQLHLLGAEVLPCEEEGQEGLMLKAYDVNDNLSPLKVSLFPLTAKSKTQRSWFGAFPWDFYVRFYVEEIPELDEYSDDAALDECFFTTLSTHQKGGADLIAFLLNSLRDDFGLQLTLAAREQ
jgi:hypothetical protein